MTQIPWVQYRRVMVHAPLQWWTAWLCRGEESGCFSPSYLSAISIFIADWSWKTQTTTSLIFGGSDIKERKHGDDNCLFLWNEQQRSWLGIKSSWRKAEVNRSQPMVRRESYIVQGFPGTCSMIHVVKVTRLNMTSHRQCYVSLDVKQSVGQIAFYNSSYH